MQYNFEWDPGKAKENLRKHKVGFERASEIFLDPFMLSIFDEKHSKFEDRWITIRKDRNDAALVVLHTFHEVDSNTCKIRIISARKAMRKEGKQYSER